MSKIKDFVKKNKKEIAITVGMTVLTIAGIKMIKKTKPTSGRYPWKESNIDLDLDFDIDPKIVKNNRFIDEAVFTSIAPHMEEMILAEGLDEGIIDQTFKVFMPKNGDFKNGSYTIKRNVQVLIRDAGDVN